MTIVEAIASVAGGIAAASAAYGAVARKIDGAIGKKPSDDDSLRDVTMRIEGKLDAHREDSAKQFEALSGRVAKLERQSEPPPARFFPPSTARRPR